VKAAKAAFKEWRHVPPLERAKMLKEIARVLRENAGELAMIDAADCGNPVTEMMGDANVAAAQIEFFAGLVTEMKGASIPMGPDRLNFSVREPLGVVGRIVPFNHPFMFIAGKSAAPLAAGNTIVMKPPSVRTWCRIVCRMLRGADVSPPRYSDHRIRCHGRAIAKKS
jgi:betaine-aldehyde dehydrogenase